VTGRDGARNTVRSAALPTTYETDPERLARLRVLEITRLPLEDAPQALERHRTGHVRGKIVLVTTRA
jgi:hypothetical protein